MSTNISAKEESGRHKRVGSRPLAIALCVFVAFHLVATLCYNVGRFPLPGPLRRIVVDHYMEPMFRQTWSVFAPDPAASNVYLQVRARKADGTETTWFDITRCDLDSAIYHHPAPNRRYLSTFQLVRYYRHAEAMPAGAQKRIKSDALTSKWTTTVENELVAAGVSRSQAHYFMKIDRSANDLLSEVAMSRWGSSLKAVQLRIRRVDTVPFAQRNDKNVKPKVTIWDEGWRPLAPSWPSSQNEISRIYGPQGGCK